MSIGTKLKERRSIKGMTLQQVAEQSGCTAAYISQLENDKASPSIAILKKISSVLDVRIVDFFTDELRNDHVVLTPDKWPKVSLDGWHAEIKQLVMEVGRKSMQPFYTVIEPGGGSNEAYTHNGEEFGLLLEGELTLTVDDKVYHIVAPASFYYSSLLPHSWVNDGDRPCRVVWVVSPPTW